MNVCIELPLEIRCFVLVIEEIEHKRIQVFISVTAHVQILHNHLFEEEPPKNNNRDKYHRVNHVSKEWGCWFTLVVTINAPDRLTQKI